MNTEYRRIGKDFSYSDSYGQLGDNGRNNYQIGLNLSIPLGREKKDSQDLKRLLEEKRFLAEKEQVISKMSAYHSQVVRSIILLKEIVVNQRENSVKLAKSLSVSRKKYNQARITVRELINDQDLLLQSNLAEIETKLRVVTTLLDYFSVFTETPCKLNRTI